MRITVGLHNYYNKVYRWKGWDFTKMEGYLKMPKPSHCCFFADAVFVQCHNLLASRRSRVFLGANKYYKNCVWLFYNVIPSDLYSLELKAISV